MIETSAHEARAVILCAGRGSRLGALTRDLPKVLAQLAGRSLLEWKLRALNAIGVHEIYALTGYAADKLSDTGLPCIRNERWASTNMVSTLLCADSLLGRPGRTLVCYGDVVFHPEILQATLNCREDIVLPYDRSWRALWEARFADPTSDVESFSQRGGRLMEIGRRVSDLDSIEGQFMGLLAITREGWTRMRSALSTLSPETIDRTDTTALLSLLVASGAAVHAVGVDGRWCEVDSQNDLDLYRGCLLMPDWQHDWRWEKVG